MIINGKDLYEAWLKWTESRETNKIPFVIRHETWWGDERNTLVRDIRQIPNSPSQYEVKLFNHKFRPITICIHKTHKFELIEDGRFEALDWK